MTKANVWADWSSTTFGVEHFHWIMHPSASDAGLFVCHLQKRRLGVEIQNATLPGILLDICATEMLSSFKPHILQSVLLFFFFYFLLKIKFETYTETTPTTPSGGIFSHIPPKTLESFYENVVQLFPQAEK